MLPIFERVARGHPNHLVPYREFGYLPKSRECSENGNTGTDCLLAAKKFWRTPKTHLKSSSFCMQLGIASGLSVLLAICSARIGSSGAITNDLIGGLYGNQITRNAERNMEL